MGFYIYGDSIKEVSKKAKKISPKNKVVININPTRNKGQYYATTKIK